jgi:hypothetical protein
MLFDLRARGRRRAIKFIYGGLALLMGGGLVLFGIGGEVQGGLFDAFRDEQDRLDDDVFQQRAERLDQRVATTPNDAAALAELARLRYQVATQAGNFDETTGEFDEEGRRQLQLAVRAWERHLEAAGDKPDGRVANVMVQAYAGLDDLDGAVTAFETVVDARPEPTAELYAQLAALSYQAGQTRKGDLARDRALELAGKDDREQIKAQLESAKTQAQQQALEEATQGAGGGTSTSLLPGG